MAASKNDAKKKALYNKMVDKRPAPASVLNIQAEHLPDIKKWDVGKEYDIKLKAKMVSKEEGGWNGKQPLKATFKIGEGNEYGEIYDD